MSNYQSEIQQLVDRFVSQLTDLWRRAAVESLTGIGEGRGRGRFAVRGRGRGVKRTMDELDQLADQFVGFVREHPGLRIEQINKQLGTTTKDLALPIRKLLSEGAIKSKGKKRSTSYYAGEGGRKKKTKN